METDRKWRQAASLIRSPVSLHFFGEILCPVANGTAK